MAQPGTRYPTQAPAAVPAAVLPIQLLAGSPDKQEAVHLLGSLPPRGDLEHTPGPQCRLVQPWPLQPPGQRASRPKTILLSQHFRRCYLFIYFEKQI